MGWWNNLLRKIFAPPKQTSVPTENEIVLLHGDALIEVLNRREPHEILIGDWKLGTFWYHDEDGHMVSLGMECDLYRFGFLFIQGWNGYENHIGTYCNLQPGDALRFSRVFDHTAEPPQEVVVKRMSRIARDRIDAAFKFVQICEEISGFGTPRNEDYHKPRRYMLIGQLVELLEFSPCTNAFREFQCRDYLFAHGWGVHDRRFDQWPTELGIRVSAGDYGIFSEARIQELEAQIMYGFEPHLGEGWKISELQLAKQRTERLVRWRKEYVSRYKREPAWGPHPET